MSNHFSQTLTFILGITLLISFALDLFILNNHHRKTQDAAFNQSLVRQNNFIEEARVAARQREARLQARLVVFTLYPGLKPLHFVK